VFKAPYLFGKRGRVNRWAYKHHKHLGKGYSDHLPIVATFSTEGSSGVVSRHTPSWWERTLGWIGSLWDDAGASDTGTSDEIEMQRAVAPPKPEQLHMSIGTIAQIKADPSLSAPVRLDDACVVFKRRDSAVIQQTKEGEAILIYRAAMQLEEGNRYNLVAHKKKQYKGLDELTDIEITEERGACDVEAYVQKFSPDMMRDRRFVGRVVRSVEGEYARRAIFVDGVRVSVHFQKQAGRPRSGIRIRIKRAMIGYYKDHMELQVWDKGDWGIR
jgi:hypothetical protein